jgi:hypothetical protein
MSTSISTVKKRHVTKAACLFLMTLLLIPGQCRAEDQPRPMNAILAILDAFDRVTVVALGGGLHGTQNIDDFARELIRNPRFTKTVRNVVIELANSRYQDVLDRYVAGENIPIEQVQPVWRDTTQLNANPAEQKAFIGFVRELNQQLPPEQRIRVLAGDPPIDWSKVNTRDDISKFSGRDANFASVVLDQVLAKHQKALLLAGDGHLVREPNVAMDLPPVTTVTMILEQQYPHSTHVIIAHDNDGFGGRNKELELRLANWRVPSIAELQGNWIGTLSAFKVYHENATAYRGGVLVSDPTKIVDEYPALKVQDLADAFLYLGPS